MSAASLTVILSTRSHIIAATTATGRVTGTDTGPEHRRPPPARVGDPVSTVPLVVAGDERGRRDDVDAGLQDMDQSSTSIHIGL